MGSCCGIALLGFGTVGSAVARRLVAGPRDLPLTHMLDRGADRKRGALPATGVTRTTSIDEVRHSGADIVVEAMEATGCSLGDATAVAVVSDLAAIARDRAAIVPAPVLTSDFIFQPSVRASNFRLRTSDFSLAEAL